VYINTIQTNVQQIKTSFVFDIGSFRVFSQLALDSAPQDEASQPELPP